MTSLIKQLAASPQQFEFFQAVRLLETWAQQRVGDENSSIKFSHNPTLQYTNSEISDLQFTKTRHAELTVNFMGLTSPQGLLPLHYTEQTLHLSHAKNSALLDFLQWLQQRSLSFFYLAWRKHHAIQTEPAITNLLQGITGQGLQGQRMGNPLSASFYIYYANHLAKQPSARSLCQLLSDYFAIPVTIEGLQGEWLPITAEYTTCLTSQAMHNNCLGMDMTAGNRIWQCQHKFHLRMGPLTQQQLNQFLPNGNALPVLKHLVRRLIGPQLQFAVRLVVKADHTPQWQLGSNDNLQLGWSTWLNSRPRKVDVEDIIFQEKSDEFNKLSQ